jgi:DNA mismatch repair protein MutS
MHDTIRAKALFATHYHELTELEEQRAGASNFTIAVAQSGEKVQFSHQLVPGAASRSYGIQVADLAGLPTAVIERARSVLRVLEDNNSQENSHQLDLGALKGAGQKAGRVKGRKGVDDRQLSLFSPPPIPASSSEVERMLKSADLNQMTPMQALNFLHALADKVRR